MDQDWQKLAKICMMKKVFFVAENGQKGPNELPIGDKKWLQMERRRKKIKWG